MKINHQHSSEKSEIIYFTKARTALKYGLQTLGLSSDQSILIPDFICDSVISPILENSLQFSVYETTQNLSPVWASVESSMSENTKALLMVHYFGQPQDIDAFKQFAKKHNLFLIEDNAHGHSGTFKNKMLGTFGDIGISSPRKFGESGGLLYLNKNYDKKFLPSLSFDLTEKKITWPKKFLNNYPTIKHRLKLILKKRELYENPRAFRAKPENEFYLSALSVSKLKSLDWDRIAESRRERYLQLQVLAEKRGLKPVFNSISSGSNPWCFAAYAQSNSEAISWFNWGWKNNIEIFSWPVLREEQLSDENKAFQKWKKIVCFILN